MKVLQIIDTLRVGGAEKMVVSIANLLVGSNIQSDVLVIGSEVPMANQVSENCKVYVANRKWKWNIFVMWRIREIVNEYDIVQVHLYYNYLYIRFIQLFFFFNSKVLLHDHDNEFVCKGLLWKTLFCPKEYITVNKRILVLAREYFGERTRCHLLPNFIANQIAHNTVSGGGGLVMVGNILPVKNYEFVLDIIADIKLPLTIYGNVYDQNYFKYLQRLIHDKRLESQVSFVHQCQNVQPLLAQYDLAIHAARTESGPLVVLEYMSSGLPFITYDTGEIVGIFKGDFPEFVLESFDKSSWVNQARLVLDRGRKVYAEKLIQNFMSKRLTENYLEQCLAMYRAVLRY